VGSTSSKGDDLDTRSLTNRVVIIGDESRDDMHASPIGEVSGVVLQANYLEAILGSRYFVPAPTYFDVFLVMLAILVIERIFVFTFSPVRGFVWGSLFVAGMWLIIYTITSSSGYISSAWFLVVIVLAARYFSALESKLFSGRVLAKP
jgi:CHASE2 domain-containing sensor protein